MKTYKITGNTNGYIAARDINFNGKQKVTIATDLTHEQATAKLEQFFNKDYENAVLIESENEWLMNRYFGMIEEQATACNMTIEDYFEKTAKRWKYYSDNTVKNYMKYEGEGYYDMTNYGGRLFKSGDESYEYDSRYYRIEENNDEE
jgi:hypothetical protein